MDSGNGPSRRVAVLGTGVSGIAAANLLLEAGFEVQAYSQKDPEVAFPFPVHVDNDARRLSKAITGWDPTVVVASPGVPPHSPLISNPLKEGIPVLSEVQLAWDFSHGQMDAFPWGSEARDPVPEGTPWLCVTGTNGKTTTVGMLAAILRADGLDAVEAGNIGVPIAEVVRGEASVLAVELSSFQLELSPWIRPTSSICLNIDSDHLDWHGSRARYAAAKARVYDGTSRTRLYFDDQPETRSLADQATNATESELVPLFFGKRVPGSLSVVGGEIIDDAFEGQSLVSLDQIELFAGFDPKDPGRDPLVRDALAATALARSIGVSSTGIQRGLAGFSPQGHRRSLVARIDDVTWIDDSKATNVHAALAAAKTVNPGTLIWILGGDAKGQDLSALVHYAAESARAVVLIGADQSQLGGLFDRFGASVPLINTNEQESPREWFPEVVRACARIARPGDTVLLAPGCASWDQFQSYSERGDMFAEAVRKLAVAKGE